MLLGVGAQQLIGKPVGKIQPVVVGDEAADFFSSAVDLDWSFKIKACFKHFQDGLSWQETGVIDDTVRIIEEAGKPFDELDRRDQVVRRYDRLDELYESIKNGSRIFSQFGDDAIIHIGPEGEIYFGGGAHHRCAIAYILDVSLPVRIGIVHCRSISVINALLVRD